MTRLWHSRYRLGASIVALSALTLSSTTLCVGDGFLAAQEAVQESPQKAAETPDRAELERRFEETLSGSVLIGSFTTTGEDQNGQLSVDRYTIESITKGHNDYWIFAAQVQYGGRDVKMRMPLEVKWAGDTPVITVTNVLVPGLGVFTARVLFYGNQYAGTWSAGDHGGHMFGRIEKMEKKEED